MMALLVTASVIGVGAGAPGPALCAVDLRVSSMQFSCNLPTFCHWHHHILCNLHPGACGKRPCLGDCSSRCAGA